MTGSHVLSMNGNSQKVNYVEFSLQQLKLDNKRFKKQWGLQSSPTLKQ